MKVGAIQSSFIPWRGYFDFIRDVDLFVFLDDVQYTRRDWRNRNKIKTSKGLEWLTVPVRYDSRNQLIEQTMIDYSQKWMRHHFNTWRANYSKACYFDDIQGILTEAYTINPDSISQLNVRLIRLICAYLDINTPLMLSSDAKIEGAKTERLINLLQVVGGKSYLSGPSADGYLDKDAFRKHGIRLEYKSYDYDPYPQLWGSFEGGVSVLDLIANCGPRSKELIRSSTPNTVVVP